jgi:hypothetical protein
MCKQVHNRTSHDLDRVRVLGTIAQPTNLDLLLVEEQSNSVNTNGAPLESFSYEPSDESQFRQVQQLKVEICGPLCALRDQ